MGYNLLRDGWSKFVRAAKQISKILMSRKKIAKERKKCREKVRRHRVRKENRGIKRTRWATNRSNHGKSPGESEARPRKKRLNASSKSEGVGGLDVSKTIQLSITVA